MCATVALQILHSKPSLDASSLRSDVMSSINILSLGRRGVPAVFHRSLHVHLDSTLQVLGERGRGLRLRVGESVCVRERMCVCQREIVCECVFVCVHRLWVANGDNVS